MHAIGDVTVESGVLAVRQQDEAPLIQISSCVVACGNA